MEKHGTCPKLRLGLFIEQFLRFRIIISHCELESCRSQCYFFICHGDKLYYVNQLRDRKFLFPQSITVSWQKNIIDGMIRRGGRTEL